MALTDNLLAYWNFNDTSWSDLTGNGHNLIQNGSNVNLVDAVVGKGANFSGGNTYLSTGTNIVPTGLTQLSMAIWVKSTADFFAMNASSGQSYGSSGQELGSGGYGNFSVLVNNDGSRDRVYGNGINTQDGNWHHIVGTWNQFGHTSIYVDGSLVGQISSSGKPINSNIIHPINFNSNGDATYAVGQNGQIDEAGYWTRELSAAEVTQLYGASFGTTYPNFTISAGPQLWFNNSTGDGDLSNLSNYWLDSGFTTHANSLPGSSNIVYIDGLVSKDTQGIGDVGFYALFIQPTGLVENSLHITSVRFRQQSLVSGEQSDGLYYYQGNLLNGGWNGQYYTSGLADNTFTGPATDFTNNSNQYYINGVGVDGGFNGTLYGIYAGQTGSFIDYGFDPTGSTSYFFVNGLIANNGYNGQHYYQGIPDSFTGADYDYYYGEELFFINGTAGGSGGYGGQHYTNGFLDSFTGSDFDYNYDATIFYINGSAAYVGYDGQHYNNGSTDYYSGIDFDAYYNASILYLNGSISSGGWSGSYYTNGYFDPTFTGFAYDYSFSYETGYVNGTIPSGTISANYPSPSDVRLGVSYGLSMQTGTYVGSGGGSTTGINLGQLIGLPPFIQL